MANENSGAKTTNSGDKRQPGNRPIDDHAGKPATEATARNYWRANLQLLGALLAIWFIVSFGAGILFAEHLNKLTFLGMPLGFWFAQQGSIYIFVILIFVYATVITRIERKFGVGDE